MLEPNSQEHFDSPNTLSDLESPDLGTKSDPLTQLPRKTIANIILPVVAVLSTLIAIWIWVENSRLSQRLQTEQSRLTSLSSKNQPKNPQETLLKTKKCPECNLIRANLKKANLREAYLWKANLENADLNDANLELADLRGATLAGADLRDSQLASANLGYANLT